MEQQSPQSAPEPTPAPDPVQRQALGILDKSAEVLAQLTRASASLSLALTQLALNPEIADAKLVEVLRDAGQEQFKTARALRELLGFVQSVSKRIGAP